MRDVIRAQRPMMARETARIERIERFSWLRLATGIRRRGSCEVLCVVRNDNRVVVQQTSIDRLVSLLALLVGPIGPDRLLDLGQRRHAAWNSFVDPNEMEAVARNNWAKPSAGFTRVNGGGKVRPERRLDLPRRSFS